MQNESRTASRLYYTAKRGALWIAEYQPLNPKTGKPWQASRRISAGENSYVLSKWVAGSDNIITTGVILGAAPAAAVWSKNWHRADTGFSTEELALAAIAAEKTRSGK